MNVSHISICNNREKKVRKSIAGKPIDYSICFGFTDADNDSMECWSGNITVDLSEYANELKKAIIKVLVDKFF